jgi:uncharacterized protein YdhG (YjbR/CyaY superfamily)
MKPIPKKSTINKPQFSTIDEYHALFGPEIQLLLSELRKAIQQAAPDATEAISYNMPTFKQRKNLVHYAAYKNHIGFYPSPKPIIHFQKELEDFNTSKGAIQFPIDAPLPLKLIHKIVRYRVAQENND